MTTTQCVGPITWTRTSALRAICDPFEGVCWRDLSAPLQLQEVDAVLEAGTEKLHAVFSPATAGGKGREAEDRLLHAQKVAWFARHGFQEPLDIDVGVPIFGCHVRWKVQDGNHRLAAAIYRQERLGEDPWLALVVSGSINYARELGLMRRTPAIHRVEAAAVAV
jgi:hypothetical protein